MTETLGGQTTTYTWDDEDRLTQMAGPSGTSSFGYNGLGLRTGKTDSTGIYAYVCDGTSPGSPVLADGLAVYTPGFSDHRGSTSTFSHPDFLGSLRFLTDSGQNVTANLLSDAFGETVLAASGGTDATPFGWNGSSGYQSDADGLKLLGHRYYDTRIGRFITQDPAGDGDNWYAYAGNNPVNHTDPLGLMPPDGPGSSPVGSPGYGGIADGAGSAENFMEEENFRDNYNEQVDETRSAVEHAYAEMSNPNMWQAVGNGVDTVSIAAGGFGASGPEPWLNPSFPDPLGIPGPVGVPTYGENPYDYLVGPLFDLSKEDWHDIFSQQASIGRWETVAGGLMVGINKTAINPNYVSGLSSLLADRNPYAAVVGSGLVIGGGISFVLGTIGAYLTK